MMYFKIMFLRTLGISSSVVCSALVYENKDQQEAKILGKGLYV